MIEAQKFFYQPVKNDLRTYDNIQTIATGYGDGYTTGCLLCYLQLKERYNKQEVLDADLKAIQQINCAGNLDRHENRKMFFILEEAKETILDFLQETMKTL